MGAEVHSFDLQHGVQLLVSMASEFYLTAGSSSIPSGSCLEGFTLQPRLLDQGFPAGNRDPCCIESFFVVSNGLQAVWDRTTPWYDSLAEGN